MTWLAPPNGACAALTNLLDAVHAACALMPFLRHLMTPATHTHTHTARAPGTAGPTGPTGPTGAQGLGIGSASAVNGSLIIAFTNGSTVEVPLPPGEA